MKKNKTLNEATEELNQNFSKLKNEIVKALKFRELCSWIDNRTKYRRLIAIILFIVLISLMIWRDISCHQNYQTSCGKYRGEIRR